MKTLALFLLFFMIGLSSFGQNKIRPAHTNSKLAISSVPPPPDDTTPAAPAPKLIHHPSGPSVHPDLELPKRTLVPNSEALKH